MCQQRGNPLLRQPSMTLLHQIPPQFHLCSALFRSLPPSSLLVGVDVSLTSLGTAVSTLNISDSAAGGGVVPGPRFERRRGGDKGFESWLDEVAALASKRATGDDVDFTMTRDYFSAAGRHGVGLEKKRRRRRSRRPSSSRLVSPPAPLPSSYPLPPLCFVLGWPRPLIPSSPNSKEMLCVSSFALSLASSRPDSAVVFVDERYSSSRAGGWGEDSGAASIILERARECGLSGSQGEVEPEEVWEWCLKARRR